MLSHYTSRFLSKPSSAWKPLLTSYRCSSNNNNPSGLKDLNVKTLTVEKTQSPKPKVAHSQLLFGRNFTDHILESEWTKESGWANPKIVPYHNLSLDPACCVFHYGLACFDGLKAYIDSNNKIRLFRPMENMKRLHASAARLYLPTFDAEQLFECIKELIKIEKSWIPKEKGYSLYIRPTIIGTQPTLGVGPAGKALLYVLLSPVGPYYPEGFKPVTLYGEENYCRAWPGGTGGNKVAGNYAPTILPQAKAMAAGYTQVLWLFGKNADITEVGTMNMFVFWKNKNGEEELVTAPLDGTILPGVTRSSILHLARSWNKFKVSERHYNMSELIDALKENRVIEAFGAGTAAIVSPVKGIWFRGQHYDIPLDKDDANAKAGKLTSHIADTIMGIQYGEIPHEWSVVVD